MQKNRHELKMICPFSLDISYVSIDAASPLNVYDNHIHDECEIYINVSGDVSFSVEGSFYPIMPGSIVITRPHEYHHCIYHSDKIHRHFWILFNPKGNESIFDLFFRREAGKNNLFIAEPKETEELIRLCHRMTEEKLSDAEKYFCFFSLYHILQHANALNAPNNAGHHDLIKAICYINDRLTTSSLSVQEIAAHGNVSISTLERHFIKNFHMTPSEYIKKRRLANAAKRLHEGLSITETAYQCGFSDCSRFIAAFKKEYHITPLQYKKKLNSNI